MTVLVGIEGASSPVLHVASEIADRLRKSGFKTVLHGLDQVMDLSRYEGLVFGRPGDHWTRAVIRTLENQTRAPHAPALWLFSVGRAKPELSDALLASNLQATRVLGWRHFEPPCDRGEWQRVTDLLLEVCGGPPPHPPELRPVDEWAAGIARELQRVDRAKERRRLHLSVRGRP